MAESTHNAMAGNMVNVGLGLASLLGLVQILGALGYFALSIGQVAAAARLADTGAVTVRVLQGLLGSLILLLSGGILFFQGWRLDPILQFQAFLMTLLVMYLIVLDLRRSIGQ